MNAQSLIEKAKKAQKGSLQIEKELQAKKDSRLKLVTDRRENFKQIVASVADRFKDMEGLPVKIYQWKTPYGSSNGYRVFDLKTEIALGSLYGYDQYIGPITRQLDERTNTYNSKIRLFKETFVEILETDNKLSYVFTRNAFHLDEVKTSLDLPDDKVWTNIGNSKREKSYESIDELMKDVNDFIVKVLDLEELEERKVKTIQRNILMECLSIDSDSLEVVRSSNPHGVKFEVKGKGLFRVVKKYDAKNWFTFFIADAPHKFLDLELLEKYSSVKMNEWKSLKETLSGETLKKIILELANTTKYSEHYADKYGFQKYVETVNDFYVINLNNI